MASLPRHVLTGAPPDGLCLVCDECDGAEGHTDDHDCGHDYCPRMGEVCTGVCPDCTSPGVQ